MLFKEIEAIFTQKVADLIQKGYTFNCNTMSGHQGEIAKVDLRKGNEIIRVLMFEEHSFRNGDTLQVVVGRNTKNVGKHRHDTIWNGDLEIIEETKFYKISDNFYVETEEEYKAIEEKQFDRWRSHNKKVWTRLNDDAKAIVLPFAKRQRGYKTCKVKDIERVEKNCSEHGTCYAVTVKGNTITLK